MDKEKLHKHEGRSTTNGPRNPWNYHLKYHRHGGGGSRCSSGRGGHIDNKHSTKPNFEGRISGLNCHVYDCQVDQYTNTQNEIAHYVATTFKNQKNDRKAIEDLSIPITFCQACVCISMIGWCHIKRKESRDRESNKKKIAQAKNDSTDFQLAMCSMLGTDEYRLESWLKTLETSTPKVCKVFQPCYLRIWSHKKLRNAQNA